jgi:hypothetical protein
VKTGFFQDYVVALLVAVILGALGPRLTARRDIPAGRPFEYFPPDGFVRKDSSDGSAATVWLHAPGFTGYTPNVSLSHTSSTSAFDEADLAALVKGMPAVFHSSQITWVEIRHHARMRADGTRVGLIEGECTSKTLHYRSLQLAFPDDRGTSIVTAGYPTVEAAIWEPAFDATIDTATGVALRALPPPWWAYMAWSIGGGVGGLFVARLLARKQRTTAKEGA